MCAGACNAAWLYWTHVRSGWSVTGARGRACNAAWLYCTHVRLGWSVTARVLNTWGHDGQNGEGEPGGYGRVPRYRTWKVPMCMREMRVSLSLVILEYSLELVASALSLSMYFSRVCPCLCVSCGTVSPNALLRALNPHVRGATRGKPSVMPCQVSRGRAEVPLYHKAAAELIWVQRYDRARTARIRKRR